MIKMLCKTCGTRHWTHEPCPAIKPDKIRDVTVLEPVKAAPEAVESRGKVVVAGRERRVTLTGTAGADEGKEPLTAAQRHKRFRKKHGDKYREANKLRMRKKRDGR